MKIFENDQGVFTTTTNGQWTMVNPKKKYYGQHPDRSNDDE